MNTWGNKIKLSIFGESHGEAIGIVIDGLEAGIKLNLENINKFIERRKAGKSSFTTSRKEKDEYKILSGYKDGYTTSAPLCVIFENTNTISKDYENLKDLLRPNHADYPARIKFKGFNDIRGGGHFSGRITLPLTFAGAIAIDILEEKGIKISENSVGGEIECACFNLPVGLGSPFFDSLESKISHLAFSVPAIKGISFGIGFNFANILGSEANDLYYLDNNEIKTKTNNNGGILGGLSTGMPLVFSVVVKPTSSISLEQKTVNIKEMEEDILKINGRHDACIVPRVLPVIAAVMALAILEEII